MQTKVIDRFGNEHGPFPTTLEAAVFAKKVWPDQEQDEEEEGKGLNLIAPDLSR